MSESILPKLHLAGIIQRIIILILDTLILLPLTWGGSYFFQQMSIERHTVIPFAFWQGCIIVLLMILLVRWGGTPGCFILKFRVINEHGKYLSVSKAFLRLSDHIITSGLAVIVLYMLIANLPESPLFLDAKGINTLSELYGGYWFTVKYLWSHFYLINLLIIPFNQYSRSLTDFLASSYVASFNVKAR